MWLVNEASHVSGTYLICFREHHSDVSLLFYIHPWYKNHLESQGFPGDPEICITEVCNYIGNLYDTNKANSVIFTKLALFFCAPSGARTLDPNIKSVVLYQLS